MKKPFRKITSWIYDIEHYLRFSKNEHLHALGMVLFKFLYRKIEKVFEIGKHSYRELWWNVLFPPVFSRKKYHATQKNQQI